MHKHLQEVTKNEYAKSRGLLGNVGYVSAYGLRGCVCYVGPIITWVAWVTWVKIFFTWVALVKYIFAWVFAWDKNFCLGQFLGGSSKKNLYWRFLTNILVADD